MRMWNLLGCFASQRTLRLRAVGPATLGPQSFPLLIKPREEAMEGLGRKLHREGRAILTSSCLSA